MSNCIVNINPLNAKVALICSANQLTGFYLRERLAFNGFGEFKQINELLSPLKSEKK